MKRGMPWSDEDDSSSDESSEEKKTGQLSKKTASQVKSGKPKSNVVDFEALRQYGYKGGPSILKVPPPKESDKDKDWSWSTGVDRKVKSGTKETKETKETEVEEESKEERQRTRDALDRRGAAGASRGKNYVEEEKRLLRDNGVYSGFDS
ncbi:hypothetical protein M0R45_010783 [Rubus argutus]|uniref:Uncharacterized protein n=1 Tax=Rubus argutus TaxID=59490 RepID=A0AAW1Y8W3_RUBAR